MYATAHTAVALAAKRRVPTAPLIGLMVAAQATELAWVVLTYIGVEWPTIDQSGHLHLEHMPYSHSLLFGLGGAVMLWAVLRFVLDRPKTAAILGIVFATHVVLDVIQHEPNIRILPWLAEPTLGLNLSAHPLVDFAIETAMGVACWAYYRGSVKLLIAIIALNISYLPMMLAGEGGASPMAQNRFILPTMILVTIVVAWVVIYRYARNPHPAPVEVTTVDLAQGAQTSSV